MGKRKIAILGATGSVGRTALAIIAANPERFEIEALTAGKDVAALAELARKHRPRYAVIADEGKLSALREALAGSGVEAAAGEAALLEAASGDAEWVLAAISGAAGLPPVLAAAKAGKILALANKEALVCAGAILTKTLAQAGGTLIPVDSEHHALFQMLTPQLIPQGEEKPEQIILTATGGPFRDWSKAQMAKATPEQACAHPVWPMGRKISVDSATLMNKGLELIEAHYLFDQPLEGLGMIIHPQALVHALIIRRNQAVFAHIGLPDMAQPVAYALAFPAGAQTLAANPPAPDMSQAWQLDFMPVDEARFPAPALARAALKSGGSAPAILNAANEAAVEAFLARRISFADIVPLVADVLGGKVPCEAAPASDLAELHALDEAARAAVLQAIRLRG